MAFGYSDDIFRYPLVQYIPLRLNNPLEFEHSAKNRQTRFFIYKYNEQSLLQKKIQEYNINENYVIPEKNLAFLVINGIIDIIKYRSHEVIMVGKIFPGKLHLFNITSQYFYKNRLVFNFYQGKTAKIIATIRKTMSA